MSAVFPLCKFVLLDAYSVDTASTLRPAALKCALWLACVAVTTSGYKPLASPHLAACRRSVVVLQEQPETDAAMERVQPMSDRDFEAAVKHICETGLGLPAPLRFGVGDLVMCNLGPDGWKLGRVVALHYREDHWAADKVAPYQVALEGDHSLIYVPHEDPRFCREATQEDLNIERRLDTLAPPPPGLSGSGQREVEEGAGRNLLRRRGPAPAHSETETERWRHSVSGYRDGRCH